MPRMQDGILPGGVAINAELNRSFVFTPLNGATELTLFESANSRNMPDAVTRCLSAALQEIGGQKADASSVASLSVGDRQHLMRRLQIHLQGDSHWYSATCSRCHAEFDFPLSLSQLPVKEAGASYPFADVATSVGQCRFRVPNGADQSALSSLLDEQQAYAELLRRCLLSIDGKATENSVHFSAEDKAAIEAAIEEAAPEIGCDVSVCCIECQSNNTVQLNPYACIGKSMQAVMPEIHKIAWYYHWSEDEILRMPRQRRQVYLDLIDTARGLDEAPSHEG